MIKNVSGEEIKNEELDQELEQEGAPEIGRASCRERVLLLV